MSRREQILAAAIAALNAASNPPATAYRTRIDPVNQGELPAIVLYGLKETVEHAGPTTRRRILTMRLEIVQEGAAPADAAIDPIYLFAVNTLMADATLGGLVKGLYEIAVQWETEASYQDACVAVVDFEVHYTTTENPSVPGAQ
jgi:hypothetical protein